MLRNLTLLNLISLFIFSSCINSGSGNNDNAKSEQTDTKEEVEKSNDAEKWKRIEHNKFGFVFNIPAEWEALNKSDRNDGYFISSGSKKVDIRVFGEVVNPALLELELEDCLQLDSYRFDDGYKGQYCKQKEGKYWYREVGEYRVSIYINAPETWIDSNKETIKTLVGSLRPLKEEMA